MGTSKTYNKNGGFDRQDYEQTGTTANDIKIIAKKTTGRSSTPMYSNTPGTMYARINDKSKVVNQVAVYGNGADRRAKLKDIESGHTHTNKTNKKIFKENEIHVQEYNANRKRSKTARKPSKKERRIYMTARYGKKKK